MSAREPPLDREQIPLDDAVGNALADLAEEIGAPAIRVLNYHIGDVEARPTSTDIKQVLRRSDQLAAQWPEDVIGMHVYARGHPESTGFDVAIRQAGETTERTHSNGALLDLCHVHYGLPRLVTEPAVAPAYHAVAHPEEVDR